MSKQFRTLIIVLAAVLVLVGLLLSLLFLIPKPKDNTSSAQSSEPAIELIKKATGSDDKAVNQPVKKAVIKTSDEQFAIFPNKEGQLVVEPYADLPINTTEIDSLCKNLADLTATRKLTDNSDNAADFGLDKPRATATVTYRDDSTLTIELGNESPGDDGCYVRIEDSGAIYLSNSSFGKLLLQKSTKYIGTSLIEAPKASADNSKGKAVLQEMKLSGSVRASKPFSFRLKKDSDGKEWALVDYIVTDPVIQGVGKNGNTIASAATTLRASQAVKAHPTSDDLKEYGLTDPYSLCEMKLAFESTSGENNDILSYDNAAKHIIKLGNKDKSGNYYALIDNLDVVYLLSASSIPWAETKYSDVVSEYLFTNNIADISTITVKTNGSEAKTTTFKLTHFPNEKELDKKLAITVDGQAYPTASFRDLYQVFMSIIRYGDTDAKPSGDPVMTLTLKPTDSNTKPFVARLYKQSASIYICSTNKETYTVKYSDVQKALTELDHYLNGKDVNK